MTADLRGRARALAIAAAVLITVAGLFVWFTVDSRLPRDSALSYASAILLLTVPLLFAARRLGRENDAIGPLVAGTVSVLMLAVALLAPIWLFAHMSAETRGWSPLLLVGLFLPPVGRVTATGLAASIVLAFLAVTARRIWRMATDRRLRVGVDGIATAGVILAAAAGMRTHPVTASQTAPYSVTTVQHELLRAYTCLWRIAGAGAVHGFPATLGRCQWPDAAPRSAAYGSGYILEYHPTRRANDGRVLGFALVTIDAGHRDAESFYLDESGAVRRATGARATAMSPVWVQTGCIDFQATTRAVEAYRTANSVAGYPMRIGRYVPTPDSSGDGILRSLMTTPSDSISSLGDGSTRIRYDLGRALIYRRVGDQYTLSLFTPDSLPRSDATLMDDPRLDQLRNFFRDSAGVTHVTGEQRPATTADPAVSWAIVESSDPLSKVFKVCD